MRCRIYCLVLLLWGCSGYSTWIEYAPRLTNPQSSFLITELLNDEKGVNELYKGKNWLLVIVYSTKLISRTTVILGIKNTSPGEFIRPNVFSISINYRLNNKKRNRFEVDGKLTLQNGEVIEPVRVFSSNLAGCMGYKENHQIKYLDRHAIIELEEFNNNPCFEFEYPLMSNDPKIAPEIASGKTFTMLFGTLLGSSRKDDERVEIKFYPQESRAYSGP